MVQFILDCLVLLPAAVRNSSLVDQVFLQPLVRVLPSGFELMAEICFPIYRPMLLPLGVRYNIPSWVDAFRASVFIEGGQPTEKPLCNRLLHGSCVPPGDGAICVDITDNIESPPPKRKKRKKSAIADATDSAVTVVDSTNTSDVFVTTESGNVAESRMAQHPTLLKTRCGNFCHVPVCLDADCLEVVDSIRSKEFGIGVDDLGERGAAVLQQQHKRIGRALQRLAAELYNSDTHFVLELRLQDPAPCLGDVSEPAVEFCLMPDRLVVRNNEVGFQAHHIRAICDVGASTKSRAKGGHIGQKGIGFKSVFRVTDTPEIHSGGYHIRFNANSEPVRYIVPEWIPGWHPGDGSQRWFDPKWATHIVLPFRPSQQQLQPSEASQEDGLAAQLADLQPTMLLFLRRLRRISIVSESSSITQHDIQLQPHSEDPDKVTLVANGAHQDWLLHRRNLIAPFERDGTSSESTMGTKRKKNKNLKTDVVLAFPILPSTTQSDRRPPPQSVFAFLPLRSYGLRFVVQADFVVPSSREDIDQSNPWNQWIRTELTSTFMAAVERFKVHDDPNVRHCWYGYIPLEGEVLGFFRPLATALRMQLQQHKIILTENEEWVRPNEALFANPTVREAISDSMLFNATGLHYVHSAVISYGSILAGLGVRHFSATDLIQYVQAVHQQPAFKAVGLDWLVKLYLCFSRLLESASSTDIPILRDQWFLFSPSQPYDPLVSLLPGCLCLLRAKCKIVPVMDGSYACPTSQPVYLDATAHSEESPALANPNEVMTFSALNVLFVDRVFLVAANAAGHLDQIHTLLYQMGIQKLSEVSLVEHHLIPWYKTNQHLAAIQPEPRSSSIIITTPSSDSAPVLDAFLCYLHRHWAVLSTNEPIVQALRTCCLVRCESDHDAEVGRVVSMGCGRVHFPMDYGGGCQDLARLLPGFPFPILSTAYLKLDGDCVKDASKASANRRSWRQFFEVFGVSSFLHPVSNELVVASQSASLWKTHLPSWPESPSGYMVFDAQCEEFDILVAALKTYATTSSNNKQRRFGLQPKVTSSMAQCDETLSLGTFRTLMRLIFQHWPRLSPFLHARVSRNAQPGHPTSPLKPPVSPTIITANDDEGRILATIPSSFLLRMQETEWIPAQSDSAKLHKPRDLFLPTQANRSVFGELVAYADAELAEFDEGCLHTLGIRTSPTVEACLQVLLNLSTATVTQPNFVARFGQVLLIYHFLASQMTLESPIMDLDKDAANSASLPMRIRAAFSQHKLIATLGGGGSDRKALGVEQKYDSRCWFVDSRDCAWTDPTNVLASLPMTSATSLNLLSAYYPPELYDQLLAPAAGIPRHPSVQCYLRALAQLASLNTFESRFRVVRVLEHLGESYIAERSVASGALVDTQAWLREFQALPVAFPTTDGNWTPLPTPKSQTTHTIVFINDLPSTVADALLETNSTDNQHSAQPVFLEIPAASLPKMQELLVALGFPLASGSLHTTVTADDPLTLDREWMTILVDLLPYIQRYLYHRHSSLYAEMVSSGLANLIAQFTAQRASSSVRVKYSLKASSATVSVPCAMDVARNTLFLENVDEDAEGDSPSISAAKVFPEFVKVFPRLGDSQRDLINFLLVLISLSNRDRQDFVEGPAQRLPALPSTEPRWKFDALRSDAAEASLLASTSSILSSNSKLSDHQNPATSGNQHHRLQTVVNSLLSAIGQVLRRTCTAAEILFAQSRGSDSDEPNGEVSHTLVLRLTLATDANAPGPRVILAVVVIVRNDEGETYVEFGRIITQPEADRLMQEGTLLQNDWKPRSAPTAAVAQVQAHSNVASGQPRKRTFQVERRVLPVELKTQAREALGRWGEEAVFAHLQQRYTNCAIEWVNQNTESGLPYDLTVLLDDGTMHYFEVKTSKTAEKNYFEISFREWKFAQEVSERYHLYRVYDAGSSTPNMVVIDNPFQAFQNRTIGLCLVL